MPLSLLINKASCSQYNISFVIYKELFIIIWKLLTLYFILDGFNITRIINCNNFILFYSEMFN